MRASDVGLTDAEYAEICRLMGRAPNALELGLFGALWSEHCSYKNSRALLRRLPHEGPDVVAGPGGNAGVVRLTDSWEVAFKIESHNHPSYVEPVQGAATGVGGILRDIIAMGARPIAVADLLRFGTDVHSHHLRQGVVRGIGLYGNAIGIPTVTGDLAYSDTYATNPLVNVLAVGLRRPEHAIGASTAKPGQLLVLLGQRTGRDGIHGASLLASQDFHGSEHDSMRPTVQVGDPFLGKLLMEVTLTAVERGWVGALQDLGAAGLTSAVAELSESSGVGATLWLDRVPLRQAAMTPYEIMLSETQERMLMAIDADRWDDLKALADEQEILATVIGVVEPGEMIRLLWQSEVHAEVSARWLVRGCPRREVTDEEWEGFRRPVPRPRVQAVAPGRGGARDLKSLLLDVLAHPDVRDRAFIYQQYDSTIQTRTVWGPEHDVAVLKLHEEPVGVVLSVFGTGQWASVDPYAGAAAAVIHAVSRLAALGAECLGITDGINAGNPDKAESFGQLGGLVAGVADAARALGIPVTGGNVSLHNETAGEPIWPTVMIGAVGRLADAAHPVADVVREAGARLYLLNPAPLDLGGSVVESLAGGASPYSLGPLADYRRALDAMSQSVRSGLVEAVRVVGRGGLAAALVRLLLPAPPSLGIAVTLDEDTDDAKRGRLFNEGVGQWVVALRPTCEPAFLRLCEAAQVPVCRLGAVTDVAALSIDGRVQWTRAELLAAWRPLG
ncbi:MAG: phosphoribosylformylglycinamidine synthase subunit PurL [Firmicutes bacterium]|nr:phosphoribosylformylglycinamidine synthase subunit PurL [Bacillota bacterium]